MSPQRTHFRTPGNLVIGAGAASDPVTFQASNPQGQSLLVTDQTLVGIGLAAKVQVALEAAGWSVVVWDQVEPEPKAATVRAAVELAQTSNIAQVVGLGGGSPMDVAKLVALLIPCPQPLEDLYGVDNAKGCRLPLTLIPTTAGTGSEATHVAVVTGEDGEKSPALGPQFVCDTVILDAELTLSLPPKVTADTGVDAMVHAIEAFTSGVRKNPVSDELARRALVLLYRNIRAAVFEGDNLAARENMLLGSMLAGLAFANATVGAIHALAYPLGTHFHLSHGASNAMVMTAVMRFNLGQAEGLYAELGRILFPKGQPPDDSSVARQLIDRLSELVRELGLNDRLHQVGINPADITSLVEGALKQSRILSYNITPMNGFDVEELYRSIL
jgi:alcohol dehydrogenase class IV